MKSVLKPLAETVLILLEREEKHLQQIQEASAADAGILKQSLGQW